MTFWLEGKPSTADPAGPERPDPRSLRSPPARPSTFAHRPRSRWPRASRSKASTMPSPWKDGVCARLGGGPDTGAGWKQILGRVNSYADLDPALLGRVEELIDFVAAPG
ncbi:MAG: DUF3097 family protein [Geodermatophilaceae bacterium]|nr:DUF3097 family protein [Geodermatophilaceae bacterium]